MRKFYSIVSFLLVAVTLVGCTTKSPIGTTDNEINYTLNGVSLNEYVIVYDDADIYSKFAAQNFKDYLFGKFGITLNIQNDNAAEQKNEFLVGNTVRNISLPENLALNNNEYYLKGEGTEILTKQPLENTLIPKFIAKCFGEENFGNPEFSLPQ